MRLAFSSLIFAAGLTTSAQAQDPAAQPAPAPAPEATAPATPVPAAPAPDATQPAPAEAPPVLAVEPALGSEAAPPPTLPTSGYGFEAIQVLEKVCVPVARGQKLDVIAKAHGFKLNRREQTWAKPFGSESKTYQVILYPPGANKGVCMADLRYPIGGDADIAKALNVWAFVHQPPLDPTANYTQPQDPDGLKRVRRSWEYLTANQSLGLNFSTVRKPDDSPMNSKYDMATMQYQERTF